MAAFLISRAGAFHRMKRVVGALAYVISPNGAERYDPTTAPNISAGTGVPTEALPNGSVYLRTDGTDGDDSLYMRVAGAWIPIFGATA